MNEWIEQAIELRKNGLSYAKIAKELGKSKQTISYYLKENGYGPNEKYIRKNQKQPNKKYVNENFFEVIDTEEKAYWLGFMYADGCVNTSRDSIELSLKEEDFNHIVKFKNALDSEHKIGKKVKRINNKEYVSYRLHIRNKKLKDDLIKHGCIPKKSKVLTFPKLKNDLVIHFIRGYVDGDGCITTHKTSKISLEILGTYEFLNGIRSYFKLSNDKYIYNFNHSDVKRLVITGQKAFNIIESMYKDCTISLDRKFNRYKEFAPLFRDE